MHKAFTSIELLIVLVIIAILAAIAVPNILEAQTRKMTAKSLSNMRAIDSALQAYRVEHQGSTPASRETDTIGSSVYSAQAFNWIWRWGYWTVMSTPVAYMSSVPQDPFYRRWMENLHTLDWQTKFWAYDLWDVTIAMAILQGTTAPGIWGPISPTIRGTPNQFWIDTYILSACKNNNRLDSSYFLIGRGPDYLSGTSYTIPYDPTNGTISKGALFYFH